MLVGIAKTIEQNSEN